MRARPEIAPYLIAQRMHYWLSIIRTPLIDTAIPTWKARRNYRHLVRRYPQIAARLAYSEALSFPSPLHDLEPTHEFRSGSLNTDVTNPAPAQRSAEQITASQPEPPAFRVPRMISLDEEIL